MPARPKSGLAKNLQVSFLDFGFREPLQPTGPFSYFTFWTGAPDVLTPVVSDTPICVMYMCL